MNRSIPVKEALNLMALRRAAAVAIHCCGVRCEEVTTISEIVRLTKEKMKLESSMHAIQISLLDKVGLEFSEEDKVSVVYYLTDRDGGGTIDSGELAEALRRLNSKLGSDALPAAKKAIEAFAGTNKTFLDQEHFTVLLKHLAASMNTTLQKVCLLLVSKFTFQETGKDLLQEVIGSEPFNDAQLAEARTLLAFDMMDFEHCNQVSLKAVAKCLESVTGELNPQDRQKLRLFNTIDHSLIECDEFFSILGEVAACSSRSLSDVINAMTLVACQQDAIGREIRGLLVDSYAYDLALMRDCGIQDAHYRNEVLYSGKTLRLFELLDRDHDGTLNITELALFIRKFQPSKELDTTISESIRAMFAADLNGDNRLDQKEFVQLLSIFATASGVALHQVVDFLVVEIALRDDDEKEREYIEELTCAVQGESPSSTRKNLHHKLLPVVPRKLSDMLKGSSRHKKSYAISA